MYQIVGLINKFMYGSGEDAGQTMANWHNKGRYRDESREEDDNNNSSTLDNNRIMTDNLFEESEESDFIPSNLKLVIVLSGKRKSGKDHISTLLTNYIGYHRMHNLAILRIAGPIKKEFARNNKLDFTRLLDSSSYKETFRLAMVEWSEGYREREGWNCFLKQAIKEQGAKNKPIWILNDARRPCDLEYFQEDPAFANTRVINLRVEASDEARESRGWKFVSGVDDRPTECGLDDYDDWTYIIENNYNDRKQELANDLKPIFEEIDKALEGCD